MSDDPKASNTLSPEGRNPSVAAGDVPERLRRRYYLDGRGGSGLGFYVDAQVTAPAFRDRGRQLITDRSDPNAIRDMIGIARHRGWTIITARGSASFRREAWLAGRSQGLEVRGYRPTDRDLQELERRTRARERREEKISSPAERDRKGPGGLDDPGARSRMQVVSAVVRARVADSSAQERILSAARERLAGWLERGASFAPLRSTREAELLGGRPRHGRER